MFGRKGVNNMIYMISYDLHAPTNNREKVEADIESLEVSRKFVSTTYLVKTDKSINEVERICTKHLDLNDEMLICETRHPILGLASLEDHNWMVENL